LQPADDRRHRPEVRHGGVQGRGDPCGEDRGRRARGRGARRGRRGARGLVDLRLLVAEPTDEERAAVDALLGSPRSAWEGGIRVADIDGRTSEGGHEARAQRHQLLPALHALQERAGWISPGGMNYVCERLDVPPADAYGVATFYALLSVEPRPARV